MSAPTSSTGKNWFKYFQFSAGRDSPGDARNVILVVVSLIAAVTFQAGVNPPGGLWQADDGKGHKAGTAIYASQEDAYYVFLIFNTVALATSILIIVSLTFKFPFHFEILVATGAMLITYGSSVFAVTPYDSFSFRYILFAAFVPFVVRGFIQLYHKFWKSKGPNQMNGNDMCTEEGRTCSG